MLPPRNFFQVYHIAPSFFFLVLLGKILFTYFMIDRFCRFIGTIGQRSQVWAFLTRDNFEYLNLIRYCQKGPPPFFFSLGQLISEIDLLEYTCDYRKFARFYFICRFLARVGSPHNYWLVNFDNKLKKKLKIYIHIFLIYKLITLKFLYNLRIIFLFVNFSNKFSNNF